jgi:hypothetical protein
LSSSLSSSNYNGGGNGAFDTSESANVGEHGFAGGGATDFRIAGNTLNDRVMVAAGGGGGGWSGNGSSDQYYMYGGGAGGALTGIAPGGSSSYIVGTQVSGNAFGVGGSGVFGDGTNNNGTSGGGAGYYGGRGGLSFTKPNSSGSGGSSYISGYLGCVAISSSTSLIPRKDSKGVQCTATSATSDSKCSEHYSGYVFKNAYMADGNTSMFSYDGLSTMIGNSGNGYAKITYVGKTLS